MTVIVYSKPACVQCVATCTTLDKNNIKYDKIDITQDKEAFDYVTSLGYRQLPVVKTDTEHFGGFQPEKLMKLK